MFVKVTKSKNYHYLQLVESYREEGKTRHRVIVNLGRFDELSGDKQLIRLGERFLKIAGRKVAGLEMEELDRLHYGHIVYKKLWDNFQLSDILQRAGQKYKHRFDFAHTVFYLVTERLLNPSSKLAAFNRQEKYLELGQSVELQHLYRAMDVLANRKELIEKRLFQRHRDLFNMKVDVVFYDVTTFHFESIAADELKDFGFSKAGKFNEVQVVLGLLVDLQGRPIGFELFPGNVSDGTTLVKALDGLKKRFEIRKLILVADKGINSGRNLDLIKQAGYQYIVSCRLKNQTKKIKAEVFNQDGYKVTSVDKESGELLFKYKILEEHPVSYEDESGNLHSWTDRIVLTWSAKRAHRDAKKRGRLIEKAEKMLAQGKQPNPNKGAGRYFEKEGKTKITGLDEKKINQDAQWDGYYGIQCSDSTITYNQVLEAYHTLWKIEESFRVLKSTMRTRPVFHWTPLRIKGHFVLCFIAFLLERNLECILKEKNIADASVENIKKALNSLQVSKVKLDGQLFYLKGKHEKLATDIMKELKIPALKNFTSCKEKIL